MKRTRSMFAVLALLGASACASTPAPVEVQSATKVEPAPEPDSTSDRIDRTELARVMRRGLGWVLAQVPIEDVLEGDRFVGWRIRELPSDWSHGQLLPNDVITSVNGMSLETPNQMFEAFSTLAVASELKLGVQRDGEELDIAIPIDGEVDQALAARLNDQPDPQQQPVKRKETIVIQGNDRPLSDTMVDWSEQ